MDKGLPPVTQLPSPKPGRIRHTTAEWGTARGSQHSASTGEGGMNQSRDQTQRTPPQDMAGPPHITRQPPATAAQDVGTHPLHPNVMVGVGNEA